MSSFIGSLAITFDANGLTYFYKYSKHALISFSFNTFSASRSLKSKSNYSLVFYFSSPRSYSSSISSWIISSIISSSVTIPITFFYRFFVPIILFVLLLLGAVFDHNLSDNSDMRKSIFEISEKRLNLICVTNCNDFFDDEAWNLFQSYECFVRINKNQISGH